MKKANKINLVLLTLALSANGLYAQQGFGTKTPNKAAVIDMSSTNKGMLAPRIALTGTANFAPISGITTANQHTANSLLVYNTATTSDVTPGYYYWLKPTALALGKWVRLVDQVSFTEPWRVQGGAVQATTNSESIYQTGNVAVGDFSTAPSNKTLEVKGSFKSEVAVTGGVTGTEVATPLLNPNGSMHYWKTADLSSYRVASASNTAAALTAVTGTTINTFAATDTQSEMSSLNGNNSLSSARTMNSGEFRMESYNVTGNFGSTFSLQGDAVRVVHTDNGGTGANFLSPNNRSEIMLQKQTGVRFNFRNNSGVQTGEYWFPLTTGTAGQVMTQSGTGGRIEWRSPSTFGAANNGLTKNGTTGEFELGGSLTKSTTITQNGNPLTIATGGTPTIISGLPNTTAAAYNAEQGVGSDRIVVADSDGLLKEMKAAMPKFFYAPSIALPTASDQIATGSVITVNSSGVYTVPLHTIYTNQFGGTFPTGTSNNGKLANTTRTTVLPTLLANELDYYITFFDTTVFSDVTVSNSGVMTYKIKATADVTIGSFMNIVFAVKP